MSWLSFAWEAADPVVKGNRNRWTLVSCVIVVAGMTALSFAAVPLYDLFCRVTGYGGTTQQAAKTSDIVIDRMVRIRFDASVNSSLDWQFQPVQREISMKIGESAVAFYRAQNLAATTNTGTATFNVTPMKAGKYFTKIDCFCFTEQQLEPGKSVDMPVTFYVDPDIAKDPNLDEVKTITLSYTFFAAEEDEADPKTASVEGAKRPDVN
jgi:cytochrome c oxidase assembly protein subunit 11